MNGSVPALWYVADLFVVIFEVNFRGLTPLIPEGNPEQA